MALFNWTPRMSVGITKIDSEHQKLFCIMNQLHEGILAGRGREELRPVLTNLSQYTKVHFGDEEALLRQHGYPKYTEHLRLHELFRAKVGELEDQFKAGKPALPGATLDFLRAWLSKHILGVDMQYKEFLSGKGAR